MNVYSPSCSRYRFGLPLTEPVVPAIFSYEAK
jgi:hypothetical protein